MVAKKPDYEITCYTCFGFGNCTVAWDFDKDLWVRGMCPECKGTGEASAGQIEHLRCKFNPRSYTHVDLYRHWPLGKIEKGDILITCVGCCTTDNEACNGLKERLALMSKEERHSLLNMAQYVDDTLNGGYNHAGRIPKVDIKYV